MFFYLIKALKTAMSFFFKKKVILLTLNSLCANKVLSFPPTISRLRTGEHFSMTGVNSVKTEFNVLCHSPWQPYFSPCICFQKQNQKNYRIQDRG